MEDMLTSRGYALNGVLNGVDLDEWDPKSDPHLEQNFGENDLTEGKAVNKAALQKEMGLAERPDVSVLPNNKLPETIVEPYMYIGLCASPSKVL